MDRIQKWPIEFGSDDFSEYIVSAVNSSAAPSRPASDETVAGLAVSLIFWLCLLAAAALFAAVALSPKFLIYLQLRSQFDTNQVKLVTLEQETQQIQRVITAIREDKEFAAELTRMEFDAARPDEEIIPVESTLKLDPRSKPKTTATLSSIDPWYATAVRSLASDSSLRQTLLISAALLVVMSFAMLQPASAEQLVAGVRGGRGVWRSLRDRYVRSA